MSNSKNKNKRRDFIKTALGGAAGLGAAGSGFAFTNSEASSKSAIFNDLKEVNHDVVVIGAGVAGCYAAYRLATAKPGDIRKPSAKNEQRSPLQNIFEGNGGANLDVGLYEFSGRIGGRLLSTTIQGIPDDETKSGPLQFAEYGGFRFDRQMRIVWKTAKFLGLNDQPFFFDEIKVEQNNLIYVRGEQFTRSSSPGPGSLYNTDLTAQEKNQAVFSLENYITSLALNGQLENTPNVEIGQTITVNNPIPNSKTPSWTIKNEGDYLTIVFNNTIPSFGRRQGLKRITVNIPSTPNNFSYAYARFHNAFNLSDWPTVKAISDAYENAKTTAKVQGRPLKDWSWWALKRHYLTQETVDMLEDTSGYNEQAFAGSVETDIDETFYFSVKDNVPLRIKTNKGTKSIPHLSQLTSFTKNDTDGKETAWRHITTGYSDIPYQLYKKFDALKNTTTQTKHQLISFNKSTKPNYPYQLLFFNRQPGRNIVQSADEASYNLAAHITPKEDYLLVNAKVIILALPNRSLQLIGQNNFFFRNNQVRNILYNSVRNIHALRMFIAYPNPWWLKTPAFANNPAPSESTVYPVGRSATDLGLRQLYYWCYNTNKNARGGKVVNPNEPAVLLASYVSGAATEYWRSLQKGQPFDHLSGSQLPQSDKTAPQRGGPRHASISMGLEAHRQLVEMHGFKDQIDEIPLPYYAHFEDWSKDPWGAGWHGWTSGFDKATYIPKIRQPISPIRPNIGGENVFVTGECYSNVQGWVQGALNASEALLQCNLRLKWSPWLTTDGGPYDIWLGQGTEWVLPNDPNNPEEDPCIPPTFGK